MEGSVLQASLDEIRAQRWAAEFGECVPGLKTFAVPVLLPGSARIAASVSASVPMDRPDDRGLITALWSAAMEIARNLHPAALDSVLYDPLTAH